MRLLGKYQSSTGLVSSALSCHLCMLQLLSSDTVSQASGLAALETDDRRSLTRLTDTERRGRTGRHTRGGGRRARARVSSRYSSTGVQWRLTPHHTGTRGCHGPGDDFNLSELLVLDGWAGAGWPARGDLSITVPTSLQSDSENPSLIHPSELGSRAQAPALAPMDNGWGRPGRGLAVYSDNQRFWHKTRRAGRRAPTHFKYKLAMTPGFMDLIGTQIPRVPSQQFHVDRNKFRRQMSEVLGVKMTDIWQDTNSPIISSQDWPLYAYKCIYVLLSCS